MIKLSINNRIIINTFYICKIASNYIRPYIDKVSNKSFYFWFNLNINKKTSSFLVKVKKSKIESNRMGNYNLFIYYLTILKFSFNNKVCGRLLLYHLRNTNLIR